jgi:ferredoxin
MLYIDPDECIECQACIPECPVSAIFSLSEVPGSLQHSVELNADRVRALKNSGGSITAKQEPLLGPGCRGA